MEPIPGIDGMEGMDGAGDWPPAYIHHHASADTASIQTAAE
ncbi:hypothetical protein [Streptacidiphilus fuscans]|nr:hypothetical protein [Streptacidiphilus fuscans]